MLKYPFLTLIPLLLFAVAKAQHPPVFEGMTIDTVKLKMNDLSLNLVQYSYGKPTIKLLGIHDDEDTGIRAAFEFIRFSGGTVIDCQYGGVRNFRLSNMGEKFQTDPNSIYTKAGLPIGISKFGPVDDDVVRKLERTAQAILKLYNPQQTGYLFTLHNNSDGAFGIASYLKGYELESTADSLHINFQMDPDDLIFVTDLGIYKRLKHMNVNTVLQSPSAPDNGSLSIYAMQNQIPYINVEVQHGHQMENLELIEKAIKALFETYPELKEKAAIK